MGKIIIFIFIFCLTYSVFATEYNETAVDKVVTLDGTWEDLGGTSYDSTITSSAYTSEILIDRNIYASNRATVGGTGTILDPYDIQTGFDNITNGTTLYLRGGTYALTGDAPSLYMGSLISDPATESSFRTVKNYPGETPILDASALNWINNESNGRSHWVDGVINIGSSNQFYSVIDGIHIINVLSPDPTTIFEFNKVGIRNGGGAESVTIKNCYTYNTTASGIYVSGDGHIIDNNEVELFTTAGNQEGITCYQSSNVTISNNYVHDVGNYNSHENGIAIDIKNGGSGSKVFGNRIHNTLLVGIYIDVRGIVDEIDIYDNYIYNVGETNKTINAIVLSNERPELTDVINNAKIYNNICFDLTGKGVALGWSLTPGNPITNAQIVNNVFYNNSIGIACDATEGVGVTAENIMIANNILVDNNRQITLYHEYTDETQYTIDNNTIIGNQPETGFSNWFDNNSDDPLFTNPTNGDFTLQLTSPSIDAGKTDISIYESTYDFNGNARVQDEIIDIGAYESDQLWVGADAGQDVSICSGESVTLTASGGAAYLWSTGATTASITVSPTTTQTYSVTASDSNGNTGSDDVIVTVNSITANAGADVTIDEGQSTTLNASDGGSYLWNTGATSQSITVSPLSTQTYSVTVTQNGCEDTDEVKVTVNPITGSVKANAGQDVSICSGESITLTASGGSTYLWNTGATSNSIAVSPNSTQTYTVTASDSNGNTDSDEVIVTVNTVTANAGANITINEGESTTLTASGGDTYSWSNGATTQSITVTPTATKGYTVTVTKNGCQDTDRVTVTVNPAIVPMTASAGADVSICNGESATLTASGGATYLWNTGATTASIAVSPSSTKTYSVTATDGSGNTDSDKVIVTVNSVTAYAGANVTINEGESTTLSASGGDTYSWSNGATTQSITVSPTATKGYTVTATKNGCQDTDRVTVTVNPIIVPVTASAGTDVAICTGESTILTASGGTTYLWSTGATTASITISPNTTKTYSVTATDSSGNSDNDDVIVTVNNVTAIAGEDKMINVGQTVKLTANGGDTYLWSTGQTNKSITVSPSTTINYTVTVYQNGCQDTDEIMVFVAYEITNPPPADAFAGDDISICLGESITLNASGGDTYTWSTGDESSDINVNPTRTTTYTLSATRGGITDTDTVTVSVENCNISALPEDVPVSEISIYPNPTSDIVNINIPDLSSDMNVELISSNGSLVYKETINKKSNGFYEIDLSRRLAKGVYFVRLFNADQYFIEKIILN